MARLSLAALQARANLPTPAPDRPAVKVGMSTCGLAAGADQVFAALNAEVKRRALDWRVSRTGCAGMCSMEPLVEVTLPGQREVMFGEVTPGLASRIVADCVADGVPPADHRVPTISDLARVAGEPVAPENDPRQYRIVMRNCGVIDPEEIDEYLDRGATRPWPLPSHRCRRSRSSRSSS